LLQPIGSAVQSIWNFPKPIVAAVNGPAVGAGAGLAMLCDIRVMDAEASMSFPFGQVGLSPDTAAAWSLSRYVSRGWAARLLMTGEAITADICEQIGLAEAVVPQGESVTSAVEIAFRIASTAPLATAAVKQQVRRSADLDFASALRIELDQQMATRRSADHAEGIDAFLSRRPPVFGGAEHSRGGT
jgi:2-(1,2-epoxy-1,2-dihydrophenyl)acetyl-CoA isomerase